MLPEDSGLFWFSYLTPYEGFGIMNRFTSVRNGVLVVGNPASSSAASGWPSNMLPTTEEEYCEFVRYLVKQPVVWGATGLGIEGTLLGPASRFVQWSDSSSHFVGKPKTMFLPHMPVNVPDGMFPLWSYCCPWWTPGLLNPGVYCDRSIGMIPTSWECSVPINAAFTVDPIVVFQWVHTDDDLFSFRSSVY
jgi:hypothetical protein